MKNNDVLLQTDLPLPVFIKGKVRDTYELGEHLLIIATDRVSVYDVILPNGIPDKGKVLCQIAGFWFDKTKDLIPNHVVEVVNDVSCLDNYLPESQRFEYPQWLAGRSMVVKKAERVNLEWVMRGYLSGSGWEDYTKTGTVFGIRVPDGMKESQELPEVLFTPTTKADEGHDMPMSMDEVVEMLGESMVAEMKEKSLSIYNSARDYARERGIIIADTKMEFGMIDGKLIIIDELLTPDSSRFWDASMYEIGKSQPSFDKQPVRDWSAGTGWNKQPPGPAMTDEVIEKSNKRYREAYEKLAGKPLD